MPRFYSQFSYDDLDNLHIAIRIVALFGECAPVEPSDFLKQTLAINTKQALTTEKAKSEFIIAPVLFEIARKNKDRVSFFSGYNFDVDKSLGLKGFCDFIFTKYPASTIIKEPIFCVVEAKNDNIEKGVPQCVAEMYAAKLFNEQKNNSIDDIYGCVTFGYQWLFLQLKNDIILRDERTYLLNELPHILGILQHIVDK